MNNETQSLDISTDTVAAETKRVSIQLTRCQLNTNPDISTDTVAVQFDEVTGEPVMYGGRAISSQDHQVLDISIQMT